MVSSALVPMEETALNAAVLPMLINDRSAVQQKVTRTALSGMFQPGLTYETVSLLRIWKWGIGDIHGQGSWLRAFPGHVQRTKAASTPWRGC